MLHACSVYTFCGQGKTKCQYVSVNVLYMCTDGTSSTVYMFPGPSTSMQVSVYTHVCIVYTHFVDGGKLSVSMQV